MNDQIPSDVSTSEIGNSAIFSTDRRYRYTLRRRVSDSRTRILFIMLNPSKADEERDDATIRRCIRFARNWGFGVMEVVNLFALISTDSKALLDAEDPIGPDNDAAIDTSLANSDTVVLAWGNHGLDHRKRATKVTAMARGRSKPYCMGLTIRGAPKHPLRLARTTALKEF